MPDFINDVPSHLRQYLAQQDYSLYTPIDHASWRYIMRVSKEFFKKHAHPKYLEGLKETGVTTERIPRISEMDHKLRQFGWRAVVITGFIPPEPFLEMMAHRILPIAADMRKLENIDYTPAPDIVHEAAGHAPILADKDYSSYLKKFGEIARRVIFAKEDNDLYEAVLGLSETKEDPSATQSDIDKAQKRLDEAVANVGYVSEAQQVTRLGWWSTEYGLFEANGEYLIYGAGLLSSVGESFNCLEQSVKKIPLTVDCINTSYDITKPQPQLFVTNDFKKLESVIDELSQKMAFKHGGIEGLEKAKRAQTVTTTVFESGIQVSGVLADFVKNNKGELEYVRWSGPVQLSFDENQLVGQGADYHQQGFSSPLGKIKGINKDTWKASTADWKSIGCSEGSVCTFEFESGIKVNGLWAKTIKNKDQTAIMVFKDCTVKRGEQILFDPSWGVFDMILGYRVSSVFGGAADRDAYSAIVKPKIFKARVQKSNLTKKNEELCQFYGLIRTIREGGEIDGVSLDRLLKVKERFHSSYPEDWLLRLEIYELLNSQKMRPSVCSELHDQLLQLAKESERMKMLIERGLALIH